jgi:Flp pilus assembly protein TadD
MKERADQKFREGTNFYRKAQYSEAEVDFREAIKCVPTHAEAWCGLGWTFLELNRTDDAIAFFVKALDFKPGLSIGWTGLAKAYVANGDASSTFYALQHLRKADPVAADRVQKTVGSDFAQKLAVLEFPDLARLDSPFNVRFRNFYIHHLQFNPKSPSYFEQGDWPIQLARETAQSLKQGSRSKRSR